MLLCVCVLTITDCKKSSPFAGEEEEHFKGLFECVRSNGCYSFPHAKEDSLCVVSKSSKNPAGPHSHFQNPSVFVSI